MNYRACHAHLGVLGVLRLFTHLHGSRPWAEPSRMYGVHFTRSVLCFQRQSPRAILTFSLSTADTPALSYLCDKQPLPQTVVDRLAAVVAGGGPAAANLGRLAGTVSAQLGFREAGTTAAADSARSYLGGAAQDPDLLAAEASLGLGRSGMVDGSPGAVPTANGLRSAGQTLGRQANSAFEAMATAADVNNGNPALLPNVISHQLGPMPRLLDGLVSGCTAVVPAPSVSAVPATGGNNGGGGGGGGGGNNGSDNLSGAAKDGGLAPALGSNKRMKEECDDADDARPEKKMALDKGGLSPSAVSVGTAASAAGTASSNNASAAGGAGRGGSTAGSENGGGASSSPATAAPPASSNLVARPASADFRHGGGEELLALLQARVGRLFSLDAEYTHVRKGAVPENGAPAARGATEGMTTGVANGSTAAEQDASGNGLRRVLSRLKAVRAGHFVVYVKFAATGKDECRPCDVSVLSWNEAQEGENTGAAGGGGDGSEVLVKVEGRQAGAEAGSFMDVMEGSKPWRTSQHMAFVRVSGHAFQVRGCPGWHMAFCALAVLIVDPCAPCVVCWLIVVTRL